MIDIHEVARVMAEVVSTSDGCCGAQQHTEAGHVWLTAQGWKRVYPDTYLEFWVCADDHCPTCTEKRREEAAEDA